VLATVEGEDSDLARTMNANVGRLNQLLFAAQDYAIVATR
jgi:hypothetical protein